MDRWTAGTRRSPSSCGGAVATTVRRSTVTLPVAPLGADNPLPALLPPEEAHTLSREERALLPEEMARQVGYEPLRSVLPEPVRDGYGRERGSGVLDTLVIENARLRAEVLPGLGGRVRSLFHKPTSRELLYVNPVFQPANFALNGAWYSGGIEWNIGATGHTALSCAPLHAAEVPAPENDGAVLRLWEWERLRDTPFQVDLWLPEDSDFLHVGVRIRNPNHRGVPVYWWSNIAVPEEPSTRVVAPAEETWYFAYERALRRVPFPRFDGADRSYPLGSVFPADYFHEVPEDSRKWIASLDERGSGLVQTSTDVLRGRKLFVWGSGPGGRRWQRWLTEPGTGGYAEIQAGLARTQLEHVPLDAGEEFAWLESYGPLSADPSRVHADWSGAVAHTERRLEEALPRAAVDEAYGRWRRRIADAEPEGGRLAFGSGWGALEVERAGYSLPGTPFAPEDLGPEQRPWLRLMRTGEAPEPGEPSGGTLVSPEWRELLESAQGTASGRAWLDHHLGVAQWCAADRSQAVRSWERAAQAGAGWPALRCLAVAASVEGDAVRAADRYGAALADLRSSAAHTGAALPALVREAVEALLAAGRPAEAEEALAELPPAAASRGRFRLLHAQVAAARGRNAAALAVFEDGFEVDDLREGEEVLGEVWSAVTDRPLPDAYDFRMRPG